MYATKPAFVFVVLALFPSAVQAQAKRQPPELPEGAGRAAVVKLCSNCHDLAAVVSLRRTKAGWERSIGDMVTRGAQGSEDEFEAVFAYLARHFGRIDVNSASRAEIASFLGIPDETARKIVSWREKNGAFKNLDQLKRALDAAEWIDAKRQLIAFEP